MVPFQGEINAARCPSDMTMYDSGICDGAAAENPSRLDKLEQLERSNHPERLHREQQ